MDHIKTLDCLQQIHHLRKSMPVNSHEAYLRGSFHRREGKEKAGWVARVHSSTALVISDLRISKEAFL